MKMVVAFVQPHMTQKDPPLTSVTLSMRHIAVLTAPGSPE
jgi:hypothetical protein